MAKSLRRNARGRDGDSILLEKSGPQDLQLARTQNGIAQEGVEEDAWAAIKVLI